MGDGDDRPPVVLEVLLEPGDGLGVEVVGRLVEQQQVGSAEQQPAERDAAPLATGELGDVGVRRRQPQRVHRRFEHLVEVPGVGGVDPVLEARELGGGLVGVVHRQLVEAVEQVAKLTNAVLDVAAHVLVGVELRLLLEHPDGRVRMQGGLAAIAVVEPGHDPQQRRLAGAVVAEHADPGARVEAQRDVLEDLLVRRVGPGDLVHRVDVFGGCSGHTAAQDRGAAAPARVVSAAHGAGYPTHVPDLGRLSGVGERIAVARFLGYSSR